MDSSVPSHHWEHFEWNIDTVMNTGMGSKMPLNVFLFRSIKDKNASFQTLPLLLSLEISCLENI